MRERDLKRKYGLDLKAHSRMLRSQRGLCALCGMRRKLVVDHCHETSTVRKLLCNPCNMTVGFVETRGHLIEKAKQYVIDHAPTVSAVRQ